jgi:hypothetical protein
MKGKRQKDEGWGMGDEKGKRQKGKGKRMKGGG